MIEKFLDLGQRDLLRLSKKYNIDIESKSPHYLVMWRHDLCPFDYTCFKNSYVEATFELARFLKSTNTSNCWLAVGPSLTPGKAGTWLQIAVYKACP